jgi:hypothetical protein
MNSDKMDNIKKKSKWERRKARCYLRIWGNIYEAQLVSPRKQNIYLPVKSEFPHNI